MLAVDQDRTRRKDIVRTIYDPRCGTGIFMTVKEHITAGWRRNGISKTLEFKPTLSWSIAEKRQDDRVVTPSELESIDAILKTEGGGLLIGVRLTDGSSVSRPTSSKAMAGLSNRGT